MLVLGFAYMTTKLTLYRHLVTTQQDRDGFLHTSHCDSTLWSGLLGASGVPVNLLAARDNRGAWFRRPLTYDECYDCGGSKSTISRDMLIGVLWWAWSNKRPDVIHDLIKYARRHWWVMGKGVPSRTIISPALLSTAAHLLVALGGPKLFERFFPATFTTGQTGFAAHLQVLHLLLRETSCGISKSQQKLLQAHATRQPLNPLFQYAACNYEAAEKLLANEQWWPADRLPTSADRSEEWLPQRDYGESWLPSADGKTHSGADYLFVYTLLNKG